MNYTPFILLGVGLLLIFLEFFLPGGVIGIGGGLLVILSIVFFIMHAKSTLAIVLYILVTLVFIGILIRFAIWRIQKGRTKGICLHTVQEGYVASTFPKELIGCIGEALSDLKPSGHILVKKKRYQAVAKIGYIEKGKKIEVVGGEGAHLIVKLKEK